MREGQEDRARRHARALDAMLLRHSSATEVLRRWCADRGIADAPVIRAEVDRAATAPATPDQRARLAVGADDPIGYRRVRLMCGPVLLSCAENWFVPARLTPAMQAALAGDTPFGVVIRPLEPRRETLVSELDWAGRRPEELLRHRAVIRTGGGLPIAEVVEVYQQGIAAGQD